MPPSNDGDGHERGGADGNDATTTSSKRHTAKESIPPSLARLFDSPWFDATMALTYLLRPPAAPGARAAAAARLASRPEAELGGILPQLVNLALAVEGRPGSAGPGTPARCGDAAAATTADAAALGDLLVTLSRRSLGLGARIHWLLAAEGGREAAALRDACERAALQGAWPPPFPDCGGAPGGGGRGRCAGRPTSPLAGAARRALSPQPSDGGGGGEEPLSPALSMDGDAGGGSEDGGAGAGGAPHLPAPPPRAPRHPLAPAGGSFASVAAAAGAAAGLEGLFCSSPPPAAPSPAALAAAGGGGRGRPRPPHLLAPPPSPPPSPHGRQPTSPASLRASTFGATLDFVEALTDAAAGLAAFAPGDRAVALARGLAEIDREVGAARAPVAFPLPPGGGGTTPERVVRLAHDRATLLNSRDKAPFLVWVEVVRGGGGDEEESGGGAAAAAHPPPPPPSVASLASAFAGLAAGEAAAHAQPHRPGHARVPSDEALAAVAAAARAAAAGEAGGAAALASALASSGDACLPPSSRPVTPPTPSPPVAGDEGGAAATAAALRLYGPPAADLAAAVRAASPHGACPGWALRPLIVKAGDDGRQEALAVSLLSALDGAWAAAGLPQLKACHTAIIPAGAGAALVEALPNAPSLHALKRALAGSGQTLAQHFVAAHPPGTPAGDAALENFVCSLAAGSLATHILSLRDRHNGNLLLASDGRLVHVDFGFMLGASPGGLAFETAPFKLSRELMEVLGVGGHGPHPPPSSPAYDAFRLLFVRGLLAARPLADALATLVEAAGAGPGAALPCFRAAGGAARAAAGLRARLLPGLPDGRAVSAALGLIDASADAWRTRQYDAYQKVLNGIL